MFCQKPIMDQRKGENRVQETEITSREGEKLQEERIIEIETERLRDFRNHPYRTGSVVGSASTFLNTRMFMGIRMQRAE